MSDELSIPSTGPSYRVPLQPRRRHDPARRMRVMVAGGLGACVFAWFASSAWLHGGGGTVPVVEAQSGPLRVKPANPGGLQVDGAENEIFSASGGSGEDKLAPPPQTPDLQALQAPVRRAATPPRPAIAAAHAAAAPPASAVAMTAKPSVTATALPSSPPASTGKPLAAAVTQPPSAVASATRPRAVMPPKPAADSHAPGLITAERSPGPPVTGSAHVTSASRGALVQLAALSSQHAALEEWGLLAKRMPQLLSGRQPSVSKVEHDGHTYWRLRTGGFADTANATMFCMRMRAGGASCSVADF